MDKLLKLRNIIKYIFSDWNTNFTENRFQFQKELEDLNIFVNNNTNVM